MTKGFTLIELLIVIAIVAVLAVAVVLVLNPAELLKQGRDSTRISDISAVESAVGLWLADVQDTSSWGAIASKRCTYGTVIPGGGAASCSDWSASANLKKTDGTGWVGPLNLGLISSGSPLSQLPVDPQNTKTVCPGSPQFCGYVWESYVTPTAVGLFKLGANMESKKYGYDAGDTVGETTEGGDGGTVDTWFEKGTNLGVAW